MCSCNNGIFANDSWWIIVVIAVILLWGCNGSCGTCGGVAGTVTDHCGCGCGSCC